MKKLMFLGLIIVICCLNLCAKSNEVIKINNLWLIKLKII